MKKLFSNKALSLLELIIASALVLIVIMGIFAVNTVLNNNSQDYGQKYLIKSDMQTTLNHILNNASLAVGSGTTDNFGNLDLGILIGTGNGTTDPGVGDANSFCIHQAAGSNILNNETSGGDLWLCYTWSNYQINYCTMPYVLATTSSSSRGANSCSIGKAAISDLCTTSAEETANICQGPTFLGAAYKTPVATFNPSGNQMIFSVTIQNCLNNSLSSCFPSNPSNADPANNPEVEVSGSVFPSQEGMSQT